MVSSTARSVILHYHIFKNAGTSVDQMLKTSLGDRWQQWDKEHPGAKISAREMEEFILDHPRLLAVSSHQVVPPLPSRHLNVYPIIFIRHPVDRAYSAYLFEWKKQKGSSEPVDSFNAYVTEKFQFSRRNAVEDFQTLHLARTSYDRAQLNAELHDEELLENARQLLRGAPCYGIVDKYEQSLEWMRRVLSPAFPELSFTVFRSNALQSAEKTLADKLRDIRSQMSSELFAALTLRNQLDMRLYEYALARFDAQASASFSPTAGPGFTDAAIPPAAA